MKSGVEGYEKSPFYYQQTFEEKQRWIVWTEAESDQQELFESLLNVVGDRVEYLLKQHNGYDGDKTVWIRTSGGIMKDELLGLIQKFNEWFFEDGSFQFCAKIADANDYFAYDDHGLFWIYSGLPEFETTLKKLEIECREDELITERGHWHCYVKDTEMIAEKFRSVLKNVSVYVDE